MEIFDNVSRTQGGGEWNEITEDEMPSVINSLTELWPESLIIYNFITESMKLGRKSGRTKITIFCNTKTGCLIAASKGVYRRAVVFSSSKNYSGIESILEGSSNLINWRDGSVLFSVISLNFSKHLQDLSPSISKRVEFCGGICDCYWMPTEVAKALNVECPDEMYFSALQDYHTEIVNSMWDYGTSETYDMVSDIIKFMDTIGLFTKRDSKLVSWAVNAVYGIGLLYTIEEYRNNGYGTLVVKKLANILGTTNRNPFLVTIRSNSVAKSVFGKCGFISLEPAEFIKMMQNFNNV